MTRPGSRRRSRRPTVPEGREHAPNSPPRRRPRPLERAVAIAGTWPRFAVDSDGRPTAPDPRKDRRGARSGRAARPRADERIGEGGRDPYHDQGSDQDHRHITAITARPRGRRVRRRGASPATVRSGTPAPLEEEDRIKAEVILEVPRQKVEDHEGRRQVREDDERLDPFGRRSRHCSQPPNVCRRSDWSAPPARPSRPLPSRFRPTPS